jgi:hypothetical protein
MSTSNVSPTMTPILGLIAHTTKNDALERSTEGTSNRLTLRSLSRTRRPDEAKHMLDYIIQMMSQVMCGLTVEQGLDGFRLQ